MHLSNSVTDEESLVYLATGLSHGQAHPEETEALHKKNCIQRCARDGAAWGNHRFDHCGDGLEGGVDANKKIGGRSALRFLKLEII
jgi:hypothetical protein